MCPPCVRPARKAARAWQGRCFALARSSLGAGGRARRRRANAQMRALLNERLVRWRDADKRRKHSERSAGPARLGAHTKLIIGRCEPASCWPPATRSCSSAVFTLAPRRPAAPLCGPSAAPALAPLTHAAAQPKPAGLADSPGAGRLTPAKCSPAGTRARFAARAERLTRRRSHCALQIGAIISRSSAVAAAGAGRPLCAVRRALASHCVSAARRQTHRRAAGYSHCALRTHYPVTLFCA